jgi:hypothetical protein
VEPRVYERYVSNLVDSYIEDNPHSKWCGVSCCLASYSALSVSWSLSCCGLWSSALRFLFVPTLVYLIAIFP